MLVTRPKAEAESLLRRMNRNSQLMIEILLFHQPVRQICQTSRGKRWLHILFFFSSVSSESVFFAYDTTVFTTRKLRICAYYLVFHFCHSIPRKQAGSLVPCSLWCETHSQHFPWRGQPSFVQGQSMLLCGQWVMGYCFIRLCDYILLAGQLSVEVKTFGCEAIGLFRFMRDSRVREINKATFPCRSPIVVYESMATLLAHS